MSSSTSSFRDTSTDCAICLEPLDEKETITLTCGHRWHLECLQQQLQTAKPSATKRLLFSGCQCAKCGVICEHKDLEDLTRTSDRLREKVNQLLQEQLDQNGSDDMELAMKWKQAKATNDKQEQEKLLKEAMRHFSFYLCSHCQEPYFGGTVECADLEEREELRLCMACTPQVVCRHPTEHLASIIWKCRYCCQPATHVCYGNVHFCNSCHDRNSQRVHQQQWRSPGNGGSKQPALTAIPCNASDCPFPKAAASHGENEQGEIVQCHTNGSSPDCEQVYSCVCCQSASAIGRDQVAGSQNLLTNPSGEGGLRGWQQLNPGMTWAVEESEIPVNASTSTNFVSSYQRCVMHQTIDLRSITSVDTSRFDTENARIQVSARYMARTDCPSIFGMDAVVTNGREPPQRLSTGTLDAPPDYWGIATLTLEHVSLQEAKCVSIVISGQDRRFWQGHFGSKVANCSIRLLWDDETTDNVRPLAPIETANRNRAVNELPNNENVRQQQDRQGWFLRDLVIPVSVFIILTWLANASEGSK